MKHFRWFEIVTLSAAMMMGFALSSCSDEDSMFSNDELSEGQFALTTTTITKGAVSVRTGPGTWYERIGGLHYGKTVDVIKEQGGWLNIQYGDTEGWIYRPDTDFDSAYSAASCTQEVADFIRDNYPDGYNIVFAYNGTDQAAEFHSQAEKFSKEYHTLNVENGSLKKDIYRKVKTYSDLKDGIIETGLAVVKCLEDHPREGFDDSKCSQIKNLTVMSHGLTNALNLGGGKFNTSDIPDFGTTVYGYVNSHELRIQLYACNTARNSSRSEDWYERYTPPNKSVVHEQDPYDAGEGSFAQVLSVEMGPDATVFGHTTRGHLTANYAARCYGKMANNNVQGKSMFDVYFPQSFVETEAVRIGNTEDKTRTLMYAYYKKTFDDSATRARDSFMDPEGRGERMRAGWLSEHP